MNEMLNYCDKRAVAGFLLLRSHLEYSVSSSLHTSLCRYNLPYNLKLV